MGINGNICLTAKDNVNNSKYNSPHDYQDYPGFTGIHAAQAVDEKCADFHRTYFR